MLVTHLFKFLHLKSCFTAQFHKVQLASHFFVTVSCFLVIHCPTMGLVLHFFKLACLFCL